MKKQNLASTRAARHEQNISNLFVNLLNAALGEPEDIIGRMAAGAKLRTTSKYPGTAQDTKKVRQGEAHCIQPGGKYAGLYTWGAGPCVILASVITEADSRQVLRVGLAHIDFRITPRALRGYFAHSLNGLDGRTQIKNYVVQGWEETTTQKVVAAARERGETIVLGGEALGAALSAQGEFFLGERGDLSKMQNGERRAKIWSRHNIIPSSLNLYFDK